MMRSALTVWALTAAVCHGILPEIVDRGINHIVEGPSELDRIFVEQLPEDPQLKPEDALPQVNKSSHHSDLPQSQNETVSDKVTASEAVHSSLDQKANITSAVPDSDLENDIDHGCVTDDDCEEGRYCLSDTHNSKCQPCKETDVPCTKDVECCSDQLCVWGQCSQNATNGEAGSTCQQQTDCSPDLCCAFHKALSFPVCLAKPIERESCVSDSNHLMELLSWDTQDGRPRKHCPCAGDLQCQHLGRGSMCLEREDSSEEDLTDSLYSEIDYIL
ncbi:dickkopf-related protein 3a [Kryptolebias marmoratus]|uniref:dickkopf-related protein 3a n=1 Tax=Kryptolebias marmoratus TaxID=37003 RepID=UPI0007F8CCDC|nr:dickkopf-related protein 3a [Kryptolebias marmoratus]